HKTGQARNSKGWELLFLASAALTGLDNVPQGGMGWHEAAFGSLHCGQPILTHLPKPVMKVSGLSGLFWMGA
uniref:Uncharacterized protein n=1 Tax=Salvator merianae TaxID=96440 RepID=A0A8D0DG92_SALMN